MVKGQSRLRASPEGHFKSMPKACTRRPPGRQPDSSPHLQNCPQHTLGLEWQGRQTTVTPTRAWECSSTRTEKNVLQEQQGKSSPNTQHFSSRASTHSSLHPGPLPHSHQHSYFLDTPEAVTLCSGSRLNNTPRNLNTEPNFSLLTSYTS